MNELKWITVVVVLVFAIFYITVKTVPLTWRTCQEGSGWGGGVVCLNDVKDLNQIQHTPNGCLTDGHNVICGSYWQRQDRWQYERPAAG